MEYSYFSEMTAKEIAVELVKIWGVDAIADVSAYTAGYACDELGMPAGVSFLASMLTGCTVSVGVGGYVFTDSSGKIVKELDADEMQILMVNKFGHILLQQVLLFHI